MKSFPPRLTSSATISHSDSAPSPAGYSPLGKWLHWLVFSFMSAQFVVGYVMADADDEDRLLPLHVALGVSILLLAVVRVVWRKATSLPPWAPTLSTFERRYAHYVERLLYLLMFAIPLSGLGLAVADERGLPWGRIEIPEVLEEAEDLFEALHIGSHITFFIVFALHIGLVLKHQLVDRDKLLNRML